MKTLFTIVSLLTLAFCASAQKNYVEIRQASPLYDYQEYSCELPQNFNLDIVHIGVEGQDQLFLGLGRHINVNKTLTVTPYLYAVVGSNNQRGVMVATNVIFQKNKWKASGFVGSYFRLKGGVSNYTALDTADVSRGVSKKIDVGVSTGFFRQEGKWNVQVGPLVRLNDKRGAWVVSYRIGQIGNELRFTRTFSF